MDTEPTRQAVLNKARLDKFILVINIPRAFKNIITKDQRTNDLINQDSMQFSIYGSPVPNISVPHIDLPYGGQTIKVSSHARPTYPPLVVNFTIDNYYNNWWFIWKWLDLLNGAKDSIYNPPQNAPAPNNNVIPGTLTDYSTLVTVYGMAEFNKQVIQFDYHGAFVTDLSEIVYNYRSPDEAHATFTLQYSQFEATLL